MTEEEAVKKSVQERQTSPPDQVVPWPSRSDTPINEFTTEGYISCAFPTLLPSGAGEFLAPRQRVVTIGNYFKHLILFGEGQFAKHPRFRYFALNTEMRWRALQTGRIYINQHPEDARLNWMNCGTWLVEKEKSSANVSCTLPAACVELISTGSSREAGWSHTGPAHYFFHAQCC